MSHIFVKREIRADAKITKSERSPISSLPPSCFHMVKMSPLVHLTLLSFCDTMTSISPMGISPFILGN